MLLYKIGGNKIRLGMMGMIREGLPMERRGHGVALHILMLMSKQDG
jgi:hypothetical protein